jgi:hypothetical protein
LAQLARHVYGPAEEVRALLTKVADTAEPIKAHVTRGMNELHKAS